jgi:hypothetical protein
MHTVSRVAAVLVLLLSLLAPTMVCALPGSQMTPAERACCRHMKDECGQMKMPASHGCCQKNPEASRVDAVQPHSSSFHQALFFTADLPQIAFHYVPVLISQRIVQLDPSPPLSDTSSTAVLRI